MGKGVAVVETGNRSETAAFLQYLKSDLNMMTAQWVNGRYFVYLDRKSDGGKKRKLKVK